MYVNFIEPFQTDGSILMQLHSIFISKLHNCHNLSANIYNAQIMQWLEMVLEWRLVCPGLRGGERSDWTKKGPDPLSRKRATGMPTQIRGWAWKGMWVPRSSTMGSMTLSVSVLEQVGRWRSKSKSRSPWVTGLQKLIPEGVPAEARSPTRTKMGGPGPCPRRNDERS